MVFLVVHSNKFESLYEKCYAVFRNYSSSAVRLRRYAMLCWVQWKQSNFYASTVEDFHRRNCGNAENAKTTPFKVLFLRNYAYTCSTNWCVRALWKLYLNSTTLRHGSCGSLRQGASIKGQKNINNNKNSKQPNFVYKKISDTHPPWREMIFNGNDGTVVCSAQLDKTPHAHYGITSFCADAHSMGIHCVFQFIRVSLFWSRTMVSVL